MTAGRADNGQNVLLFFFFLSQPAVFQSPWKLKCQTQRCFHPIYHHLDVFGAAEECVSGMSLQNNSSEESVVSKHNNIPGTFSSSVVTQRLYSWFSPTEKWVDSLQSHGCSWNSHKIDTNFLFFPMMLSTTFSFNFHSCLFKIILI